MARVILVMDVHCHGCSKKIRKALKKVPGVEKVTASVDSGEVVVWGSADPVTLRARLLVKMKKTVTIVPEAAAEEAPAPPAPRSSDPPAAAPSSSDPPPAAPSSSDPTPAAPSIPLTPGPPNRPPPPLRTRPSDPPPQYYQPPPAPEYYRQPPPPQYYQQPPSDHPQYETPSLPQYHDSYSTPDGGSYGYHNYQPHPAGPHHVWNDAPAMFSDENPNACSIQ